MSSTGLLSSLLGSSSNASSSNFQYLTSTDKKNLEEFEEFRQAFATAKVSRIARKADALSTKNPVPFLNKAYYKPPKPPMHESMLPPYLQTVVKLQEKDGKWQPSSDLTAALGGAIPDPPGGMTEWRWATALVMAFLRRYPEHIGELRLTYEKGLEWTEPRLIEEARGLLPPREAYYDLDPDLVKVGEWKQSVKRSYDLGGYQNFLPNSLKEKRANAQRELEDAIKREAADEVKAAEAEKLRKLGAVKDDRALKLKYLKQRAAIEAQSRALDKKQAKLEVKRQPLLGVEYRELTKKGQFNTLKERWTGTCHMNEEMSRLAVVKKTKNMRPSWNGSTPAIDSNIAKRMELGADHKQKFNGPSPMAEEARRRARAKMEEKRRRNMKKPTELERAIMATEKHSRVLEYSAAQQQETLKRGLQSAQAEVVSRIIEYEAYIQTIKQCLERCLNAYRKARVVAARQGSFDELTSMLGQPYAGRKGYNDWKGRDIKGIVLVTVELVESVGKWREAVLAAQGKLGARNEYGDLIDHGPPMPFMWNGKNILLEIPYGLDFLKKCKELVGWYGNDFVFDRNPFMIAIALNDRPVTPIKATREVVVNGVKVEQISSSLAEEANKQKAYFDHCQKIIAEGGSWWPSGGGRLMGSDLWRRVRAAEKTIISEETVEYQKLVSEK